ncbi:MAG TPA: hypothetical protein VJ757_07915 [Pseudonocardiaceae bacterium]|nr:hypothetical protein [Pseudonocardiaceae bacterium]
MARGVLVVGSGAGKTTLARQLGALLDLPVVHLDQHYWRPGWIPTERDAWSARGTSLAGADRWVIDATTPAPCPGD